MAETEWHCVIACHTYKLLYIGRNAEDAARQNTDLTYRASALTLGEAERRAAIGAGRKTTLLNHGRDQR